MGSGNWFKTIVSRTKSKQNRRKKVKGSATASESSNGSKLKNRSDKVSNALCNGMSLEEIAAIQIQCAFRRFKARKKLHHLKGLQRLHVLHQGHSVKKQTSSVLSHLQSWSKIQADIRARRTCMVTEGRIKQKKQENQVKLDAKLHDIEVEWCGGSDTMEEILSRIHQREEASVKRERAMAYAFSHQWRANNGQGQFSYEVGKSNWGWSWVDRWIAAPPWESRQSIQLDSHQKAPTINADKKTNPIARRVSVIKLVSSNGNGYEKKTAAGEPSIEQVATSSRPKPKTRQAPRHPPIQTSAIAV